MTMEVNSANLKALNLTIKTTFNTSKDNIEDADLFKKFADISPSNAKVQGILTLTDAPGMREFKSERVPGTISDVLYQVTHRKWESTLNVKREDIEDDNIGYIPAAVKKMTAKSRKHYTVLASAAVDAGFTAKMSDGVEFFHANRKNRLAGVSALTVANYEAAFEMLETMTDTDGVTPMGHKAKILMVGPKNRAAANKIVGKETLANGETNEHYKEVEVFVNPYLGASLNWFILDNTEGVMPVTIVERIKADKMIEKNDLNSDRAFDADVFAWGLRGRYDAGYADPTLIVGGKGA